MKKLVLFIFALSISFGLKAQKAEIDVGKYPPLVTFSAEQDHANMMGQLGIKALRPGPKRK